METWQLAFYALGVVILIMYFKRRSDRLSRDE